MGVASGLTTRKIAHPLPRSCHGMFWGTPGNLRLNIQIQACEPERHGLSIAQHVKLDVFFERTPQKHDKAKNVVPFWSLVSL